MSVIYNCFAIAAAVMFLVVVFWIVVDHTSTEGYEDQDGFHRGQK